MKTPSDAVRLPSGDDSIAPVRILDAEGRVMRVISADEFRRTHPRDVSGADSRRRRSH